MASSTNKRSASNNTQSRSTSGKSSASRSSSNRSSSNRSSSGKRTSSRSSSNRSSSNRSASNRKPSGNSTANASKKSTSTKGTASRVNVDTTEEQVFNPGKEISLIVLLGIAVLLFLANIGFGGLVGEFVRTYLFGAFGIIAYAFPVIIFLMAWFLLINRRQTGREFVITLTGIIFFLLLCTFTHLVSFGNETETFTYYWELGSNDQIGGGLVGCLIGQILTSLLDTVLSYIVVVVGMIICFVIFFQISIIGGVNKGQKKLREKAEREAERRKEEAYLRQRELELKRRQANARREAEIRRREQAAYDEGYTLYKQGDPSRRTKARGVTFDTKLEPDGQRAFAGLDETRVIPNPTAGAGEDIREITPSRRSKKAEKELVIEDLDTGEAIQDTFSEPVFHGFNDSAEEVVQVDEIHVEEPEIPDTKSAYISEPVEPAAASTPVQQSSSKMNQEMTEIQDDYEEDFFDEDTDAKSAPKKSVPRKTSESDIAAVASAVAASTAGAAAANKIAKKPYKFPPLSLLNKGSSKNSGDSKAHLQETAKRLEFTLKSFGVDAKLTEVTCGPTVTRYEIQPAVGVKVSKILGLSDDIKLNLAVPDIRIEAPIPGKAAIGIEVPNSENVTVNFRNLIETSAFKDHKSKICFAAGKDIGGDTIIADIAKMPHLLIAGSTGSGKSVCINTIIMSILYKAHPDDVKLIMVDPKVVELSVYNGIPHLMIPVVTDPKKAAGALHWAVAEMNERYEKFQKYGVRNLQGYNQKIEAIADIEDSEKPQKMPQIVIIIDELADLMMVAPADVEQAICRIAQLARAAGIHLVVATQRPSVNVITGLIKANMPSRIAFAVSSGVDSRTILDSIGAEKLLGKGDMLFSPQGYPHPVRVQGAFISDEEVAAVVDYLSDQNGSAEYSQEIESKVATASLGGSSLSGVTDANERDSYFAEAGRFIIDKEKGSIGSLQRMFKIGFNRAARIMDQLEEAGVVGPEEGTKPRKVLLTPEQFENLLEELG